jgi:hypothetical protein
MATGEATAMTLIGGLRLTAFSLATIGVVDPSLPMARKVLPSVELQVGKDPRAETVRRQLVAALQDDVSFDGADEPAAKVFIGDPGNRDFETGGVSVSTVSLSTESSPNVRIVSVKQPRHVPVGWTAAFDVRIEARGMRGATSHVLLEVLLEAGGVALAGAEHKWTGDVETANLVIRYAPPVEGTTPMTLRVTSSVPDADDHDNHADVVLRSTSRTLRVLVHEPRPSWTSTFVRRLLEENSTFDVAALVRLSRGIAASSGSPPSRLSAEALAPFDVVIVGAPEELQPADVGALRTFMQVRGGRVVFLPDRRPTGPFVQLLPIERFEEILVENPLEVTAAGGILAATELAIPAEGHGNVEALATVSVRGSSHPVVFAARIGQGQAIFSGALDAWRFRASGGGFAAFWEARIGEAALAAPRRLETTLTPSVAAPGDEIAVQVRLRPTEILESPGMMRIPPAAARLVGKGGVEQAIRLWPSAEVGVFLGRIVVPPSGRYDVQITSGDARADESLVSIETSSSDLEARRGERDRLRLVAEITGGVAVTADDLSRLLDHLRSLAVAARQEAVSASRSLWFVLAFAGVTCAEWTLRRRRGLP